MIGSYKEQTYCKYLLSVTYTMSKSKVNIGTYMFVVPRGKRVNKLLKNNNVYFNISVQTHSSLVYIGKVVTSVVCEFVPLSGLVTTSPKR